MITSITFQFAYNKKYLNRKLQKHRIMGERFTDELEGYLEDDIKLLRKIKALITDLNQNLATDNIEQKIKHYIGHLPRITHKTKKTRSYFIAGLTIHEEDD